MSFQILDFILFGIMIVSGLLALARGLTREVLSLVAWAAAAAAAYFAIKQQPLMDLALPYVSKPIIAQIAVAAAAFILVLIIVSVISVKISDRVVDSRVGAFDRTLGLVYGLFRGFALVVIAYLFYAPLVPTERQDDWVKNAVTLPTIRSAGDFAIGLLPPQFAESFKNWAQAVSPAQTSAAPSTTDGQAGYTNSTTKGLDNLVGGATEPAFGQQGATQQ
jgi:membrane protein required for colicin V production